MHADEKDNPKYLHCKLKQYNYNLTSKRYVAKRNHMLQELIKYSHYNRIKYGRSDDLTVHDMIN